MLFGISCSENKTNLTAQEFQSFALDPLNLLECFMYKKKMPYCQILSNVQGP